MVFILHIKKAALGNYVVVNTTPVTMKINMVHINIIICHMRK